MQVISELISKSLKAMLKIYVILYLKSTFYNGYAFAIKLFNSMVTLI